MAPHLQWIDAHVTLFLLDLPPYQGISIGLIEAPPRHGKSEYVSRYVSSWYVGRFPERRVILTSYGAKFAASWGRNARDLLEEWGPNVWGVDVRQDTRAKNEWDLFGRNGGMISAGIGGPINGRAAHLLIVDDYIKNAEEAMSEGRRQAHWDWWESTASLRLEPDAKALIMATRWHEDDLGGRILKQSAAIGQPVMRLRLPALAEENDPLGRKPGQALWPERFDEASLLKRKASRSPFWWNALFQQKPTRHEGVEWPDAYFEDRIWTREWPTAWERTAIALDPSKGKTDRSDFSALVFVGITGGKLWVDADIKKRGVPQMVNDGVRFSQGHPSETFIIESNAWQDLLAPEFDRQTRESGLIPLPIRLLNNSTKKEVRIGRLGTYLSRDVVRFRDTPGCRELVKQLREFPLGDHDDGPDAFEMCIRGMQERQAQEVAAEDEGWGIAVV